MTNDNILRLLTLFDSSEEAETLVNTLRNAGHIVRNVLAEDEEDMRAALEDHALDLMLAKPQLALLSCEQALQVLGSTGRDVPLIVVTEPGAEASALGLLDVGARDVVAADQHVRLRHIVSRELGDLKHRREHRQCEKMLRETEKRARDLIDTSRDAIAYVHDGMHIYANKAYLKMFGHSEQEDIQGLPIMDMVASEEHTVFKEFLRKYAKGESVESTLEVRGQQVDGKQFKATMEFSPASMEGEACTQIIIRDQSLSKELEKKLSVLSKQDLLTGLYNRTYFMEQLDKLVSRAVDGNARGAVLYIEPDNFQDIKESVGISGADLFLADIASLLKSKLGETGTLARYEGATFTLLQEKVEAQHTEKLAKGICKVIGDYLSDVNGQTVRTTVSVGISLINETAGNGQKTLLNAEKACESAHKAGGNRHILHSPATADHAEKEHMLHWSQQIKDALQNNKFHLLYQPIVSLHGEGGENYEVVLRMQDENGKEIPPAEFLPAAEQMGLMIYIDRWVIANALMILAERRKSGTKTRFFIKLSRAALMDDQLLGWIAERIEALGIDADSIVFEIHELLALNHLKQAKYLVDGLRQLRCRIGLDHFGTEPDAFESLKHLDVQYLKLDASLVATLATSVESQEKVRAISETASSRGKQTIAAFVEDANSLAVLWQCSIDFIQGYFLQPPNSELNYDFSEEGGFG